MHESDGCTTKNIATAAHMRHGIGLIHKGKECCPFPLIHSLENCQIFSRGPRDNTFHISMPDCSDTAKVENCFHLRNNNSCFYFGVRGWTPLSVCTFMQELAECNPRKRRKNNLNRQMTLCFFNRFPQSSHQEFGRWSRC